MSNRVPVSPNKCWNSGNPRLEWCRHETVWRHHPGMAAVLFGAGRGLRHAHRAALRGAVDQWRAAASERECRAYDDRADDVWRVSDGAGRLADVPDSPPGTHRAVHITDRSRWHLDGFGHPRGPGPAPSDRS